MYPIKTQASNFIYLGPSPEIADLPCTVTERRVISVWKFSDEERELIAAGANLQLEVYARPLPPLAAWINSGAVEVPNPCTVCGEGVSHTVHSSSASGHAFKCK